MNEQAQCEEKSVTKGRRTKVVKAPSRFERVERLRQRIITLKDDLLAAGFGAQMPQPSPVKPTEEPDRDPLTGGRIVKVKEPLGIYIQRVSIEENFSQRPPFDHVTDKIYRRLIRDFIAEAAMPEAKVAALSRTANDRKLTSLEDPNDVQFSIIDGLQRLYCFCIAILLTWKREETVTDGIITKEAWEYFKEGIKGDPRSSTEALLQRLIRYEVFHNIDLSGLLHYMVTFNTGQRRMSLSVQLEIMRQPLIDDLKQRAKLPIWEDIHKMPGVQKPKDKFDAKDLVLATQAFVSGNPQVSASEEAERLHEEENFLDNFGEIDDVLKVFKFVAEQLHPTIAKIYQDDINKRYLLSNSSLFFFGFAAACGHYRTVNNMKMLEGALDKLMALAKPKKSDINVVDFDPFSLQEYQSALESITSSRGKAIRRLVYDTFMRFFMGATNQLEWANTVSMMSGGMS